jgi:hypothetical protein
MKRLPNDTVSVPYNQSPSQSQSRTQSIEESHRQRKTTKPSTPIRSLLPVTGMSNPRMFAVRLDGCPRRTHILQVCNLGCEPREASALHITSRWYRICQGSKEKREGSPPSTTTLTPLNCPTLQSNPRSRCLILMSGRTVSGEIFGYRSGFA